MSPSVKKYLRFALFLGLGLTILFLVFRSQNTAFQEQCRLDGVPPEQCSLIDKLLHDFSTVNLGWLAMVVVSFTVSNAFRARRWQLQFEPLGHPVRFSNSFLTILLGYFVNLGFPRMGEVARAGALSRYERVPFERVMGTLVVDRLMDFICLGGVVGLAFIFEADTLWAFIQSGRSGGQGDGGGLFANSWVQAVLALGALGLILVIALWNKISALPAFQKIAGLLEGFWEGLRSVFRLKKAGWFLSYSAGIWVMFYLQCVFNLWAFPPTSHLGFSAALMVFVFGTLGFVIPSPGGMGTFHALAIAGLALYGISGGDAFSYANIAFFAIQIFYNLAGGTLALGLLPVLNKKTPTPA